MDRAPKRFSHACQSLLMAVLALVVFVSPLSHAQTAEINGTAIYVGQDPAVGCQPGATLDCRFMVELYNADPDSFGFGQLLTTEPVASDGSFQLPVPVGIYGLRVIDPYMQVFFDPESQQLEVTPENPVATAQPVSGFDPSIHGSVTYQGQDPAVDCQPTATEPCRFMVELYNADPNSFGFGQLLTTEPVASDGSFQLPVPLGIYGLRVIDPYMQVFFDPESQQLEVSPENPVVNAQPVSGFDPGITGAVTYKGQDPAVGCQPGATEPCRFMIELYNADPNSFGFGQLLTTEPVASDGSFQLPVPVGVYGLRVIDPYMQVFFDPESQQLEVTPENPVTNAQPVSGFDPGITGNATYQGQDPAVGCQPGATEPCRFMIELYNADPNSFGFGQLLTTEPVASDSSFHLPVPVGLYDLRVFDPYMQVFFDPESQPLEVTPENPVAIAQPVSGFDPGITGAVTYKGEDPAVGCQPGATHDCRFMIELYDADPSSAYFGQAITGAPVASDGSYHLPVPVGLYDLRVYDPYMQVFFEPASQQLEVSPENPIATAQPVSGLDTGISGQVSGPEGFNRCDASGACSVLIELYRWDGLQGRYLDYPEAWGTVNPNGYYRLNVPQGTYRAVAYDGTDTYVFTPASHSGLVIDLNQGLGAATADFTAVLPNLRGSVTVEAPGFSFCDSSFGCRIVIDAYAYDALTDSYSSVPVASTPVGSDGRYLLQLAKGTYRLVPVDPFNELRFAPNRLEGIVLSDSQPEVSGLNFTGAIPVPGSSVAAIRMSVDGSRKWWQANATVTVVDPQGKPLAGAEVHGYWTGLVQQTVVATTSSRKRDTGEVTLASPRLEQEGTVSFTVTDIVHPDFDYDAAASAETTASISHSLSAASQPARSQ